MSSKARIALTVLAGVFLIFICCVLAGALSDKNQARNAQTNTVVTTDAPKHSATRRPALTRPTKTARPRVTSTPRKTSRPTVRPTSRPTRTSSRPKPTRTTTKPKPESNSVYYKNCTEMRKDCPNGVSSSHPAYRPALDKDKDGRACEK